MKREWWIVTGGTGFIRSHFVNLLIREKRKVLVWDVFDYSASLHVSPVKKGEY